LFFTMEYVDGVDLAALLRRIGHHGPVKAAEIARQLCAGLQAAHDRGLLHRDLKPANVMLDGHGRARITDFGLAVPGHEAVGEMVGTPAYMSPEQLRGEPATAQSDLYALGLVLYEVFTGRRAFEATTLADWRRVHSEEPPAHPSDYSRDLDPAVERVILRCLEKDPASRPRSAAQVALGLPGADPLGAAVAAGETPSPQMVAAAGGEGTLGRRAAWSLLAGAASSTRRGRPTRRRGGASSPRSAPR
jgi:serine/threonine-protein kinase